MDNNKITIINQVAGPMCIDIANAFLEKGYDTRLYTGIVEPTYAQLNSDIQLSKFISYRRERAVERIFTWVFFAIQTFFQLLFSDKKRRLLIVSNPPVAPFLGLIMNILFKQQYDILIYDIYPDALIRMGYTSKNSLLDKFWSKANMKTFHRARRLVTLSKSMKNELSKYVNGAFDDIDIVPCWVDSSSIKPIAPKSGNWFAEKYNQVDKCTVLYSGNMGTTHDIESIVKAAIKLKDEKDIHFLLIGGGVKKNIVESLIKKHQLQNITLLPFQDSSVVPYSMSCGDIAIITTEANTASLLIPSKTFYYLAAGNKLIAITNQDSELSKLINENKLGYSVSHENAVDHLIEAILKLKDKIHPSGKSNNHTFSMDYGIHHATSF